MSEEWTHSSEEEWRRRKKKKEEEKNRKKDKKKEEKTNEEGGSKGGRGVKEEEAATDIEKVKAEIEDVAVEGDTGGGGGEGVLVVTPRLRGEASHAWGWSHANQRNVLTLPWCRERWTGVLPRCPPFFER